MGSATAGPVCADLAGPQRVSGSTLGRQAADRMPSVPSSWLWNSNLVKALLSSQAESIVDSDALIVLSTSAVLATPGWAAIALTLDCLVASAWVKSVLASLVWAYRRIRPSVSLPPNREMSGCTYFAAKPPESRKAMLRAMDEWLTTRASPRASAAFSKSGHTSAVSRKWDKRLA
eukprot:scaffold38454_cov202-Isochrysis_galbana.AAC.1